MLRRGLRNDLVLEWLEQTCGVNRHGAEQALDYVSTQFTATGMVPTQKRLLFERFFDESGGMQLVIHAPFGTRINRAWGLAMRKRFCRSFDFELQASADDNGIVLSLGAQHSFPAGADVQTGALPPGPRRARSGLPGRAVLHDALALECDAGLADEALTERQACAASPAADAGR